MSFEVFCQKVKAKAERAGLVMDFFHEDGRHVARCSDYTITGNTVSKKVCINYLGGHTFYAEL